MSGVFIAFKNQQNMYVVAPARPDQSMSYATFMSNPAITEIHFSYPTASTPIKYTIKQYIDQTSGNPGRFCVYINESNQESILSDNKDALDKHVRNQNKMMSEGGNRTKCSRNTKRSKRVHTSKRK